MQSEVELMVEHSDEPIVKTDVNVSREDCQQRTIDILLEVKQTRVCIKKAHHLFKDLEKTMEVSPKFMRVVEVMIADWQELVKYHRKRTLTSMLNYDLVLNNKLD
jgi:predicted O-linked N-acetylglucosamine transferase (SPINDLY family)